MRHRVVGNRAYNKEVFRRVPARLSCVGCSGGASHRCGGGMLRGVDRVLAGPVRHDVTLLDAHGPGNSRASSGGETRVIRIGSGAEEIYTRWSWRSLELWKAFFERVDPTLFRETGVLWMARERDTLTTSTLATLERVGVPHERLSRAQLESRWPQVDYGAVTWAIHEPGGGVLMWRRAVEAVVRESERAGVRYVTAAVNIVPPPVGRRRLDAVTTRSGGGSVARRSSSRAVPGFRNCSQSSSAIGPSSRARRCSTSARRQATRGLRRRRCRRGSISAGRCTASRTSRREASRSRWTITARPSTPTRAIASPDRRSMPCALTCPALPGAP